MPSPTGVGLRRPGGSAGWSPFARVTPALLAVSLLLLLVLALVLPAPAAGQDQPHEGLLITTSATADDLLQSLDGGLVLRVTLTNRTGMDLAGLTVQAPVPPLASVADSGIGELGMEPGAVQLDAVVWSGLSVPAGGQVGPFVYRVVPVPGADGAEIFRTVALQPSVQWTSPTTGEAAAPLVPLRLNGLWGEGGLRRTVLPGGLTLFTRERFETPTVSVRIAARAGSRDEDDVTSGGSHWLEHAFFLGTETRPGEAQLFGEISAVGGDTNASTGWEATDYYHLVPAENFDLAVEILSDMLINSTFRQEAFDRERLVVFEELKRRNDTPGVRAFDEFINLVFRESPLRRHPGGTIESVQNIPIPVILAYKDARYVTGNMAIAVSGAVSHDDAVARIQAAFANLPRGQRLERERVKEPPQADQRVVRLGEGERLAEIRLGWSAPGDEDEESLAMAVLEDILGSTGRRLQEEIRDQRALATSVGPSYLVFSDSGALMISATTQPARSDEVIEAILRHVQRIQEGDVSEEDVARSLRALTGRSALSQESNQAQTGRAESDLSGTLESFEEYAARLRRVTPEDVQRVAQKWLSLTNYTLVEVRL